MSVWPQSESGFPYLKGSEGTLVCVSVCVEPRSLESLLEALSRLDFPVNPQIYHDASRVYAFTDGRKYGEPVALVEFPAYEARLPEISRTLAACGFDPSCLNAEPMLEELHAVAASAAGRHQVIRVEKHAR